MGGSKSKESKDNTRVTPETKTNNVIALTSPPRYQVNAAVKYPKQPWITLSGPAINENQANAENVDAYQRYHTFDPSTVKFMTHPLTDKDLDPVGCITFYKLVSVKMGETISTKVAALLTLHVKANATISYSEHFHTVMPATVRSNVKYCVANCDVVAARFLGQPEDVDHVLTVFQHDKVKFVSNFNSTCVYELGYRVEEKNAFVPGKGCLQGIHVFYDTESAKNWWKTGMIEDTDTPAISAPVYEHQINTNSTLKSVKGNRLLGLKYRHINASLTPSEIKELRNTNVLFYKHNYDPITGAALVNENPILFECDEKSETSDHIRPSVDSGDHTIKRLKTSSMMSDEDRHHGYHPIDDMDLNLITCPLSGDIFSDPVIAADGQTYERKHIEEWMIGNNVSPITNNVFAHKILTPNNAMKSVVESVRKKMETMQLAETASETGTIESETAPLIQQKE